MKYIFTLVLAVILTGCGSVRIHEVATVEKPEIITIPDALLKKCNVTQPPLVASYYTLTAKEKEKVLTDYGIALLSDLDKCNKQIGSIKTYMDNEVIIIKKANK